MPRVTKAQKLHRRQRIEELLNDGLESSFKIAEALGKEGIAVSDRQVREDIALIGRDWHERIIDLRHVRQMRKVRAAELRNKELAAEWERSKKDKERQRAKEVMDGDGTKARTETEAASEGRLADPAYLTEQRRNDEFIAELLGLAEAKKTEHIGTVQLVLTEEIVDGDASQNSSPAPSTGSVPPK